MKKLRLVPPILNRAEKSQARLDSSAGRSAACSESVANSGSLLLTPEKGSTLATTVRSLVLLVMSRQPISQRGEARESSSSANASASSSVRNGGAESKNSAYGSNEANDCARAWGSTAYQAVLVRGPVLILSSGSAGR